MKEARDRRPDHSAVRVSCSTCKQWRDVDLDAIIAKKGADFSLINRRARCKLTPKCPGRNRFFYQGGVMRPLWDQPTGDRWIREDAAERAAMERSRQFIASAMRRRVYRPDPPPPGVLSDVWAIATDEEREVLLSAAAEVRRWRGAT